MIEIYQLGMLIYCGVMTVISVLVARKCVIQQEKERAEWNAERAKLLDRIQSGGLAEFKAQERAAETPLKRREKDEFTEKMEGEPWL